MVPDHTFSSSDVAPGRDVIAKVEEGKILTRVVLQLLVPRSSGSITLLSFPYRAKGKKIYYKTTTTTGFAGMELGRF